MNMLTTLLILISFVPASWADVKSVALVGSSAMGRVLKDIVTKYEGNVTYEAVGSGAGIRCALDGSCDIGVTDVPIPKEDWTDGILTIPVMIGAVAIAHNVPGVCGAIRLKACDLARIYTGKVISWGDDSILDTQIPGGADLRSDPPIVAFARADSSGTSEVLTQYLKVACPEEWTGNITKTPVWDSHVEQVDSTNGMVANVATTENAIGYAVIGRFNVEKEVAIESNGGTFQMAARPLYSGLGEVQLRRAEEDWSDVEFVYKENAFPTAFVGYFLVRSSNPSKAALEFVEYVLSVDVQSKLGDFAFRGVTGRMMDSANWAMHLLRTTVLDRELGDP